MATFRVDVDGKKVGRRIRNRIEDGVDSAADEINDEMRQVAKGKIRDENAVFTRELLHGFTDSKVTFGRSTVASLRNLSDHAPYQERGVSGIYKKRKTPYSYKNKKPPLDALIPWVIQNLHGSFWPDDLGDPPEGYGDSVASVPSSSSRTAGSGGVYTPNDDLNEFDPLMGAGELEPGTDVSVSKHPTFGAFRGTIDKVLEDNEYKYQVVAEVNGKTGFVGVKPEWIDDYDGKGINPESIVEGLEVYIGRLNTKGTVVNVITEPTTGEKIGAQVDLTGDGDWDDSFDPSEFISVGDGTVYQNGVPLDENRLYAGEDGFSVRGMNDDFHGSDFFPNQRVVVFNTNEKEYERATIRSFGSSDQSFKFELDDYDGTLFKLSNSGAGPWRLVGTEDWDSLDRPEQKDRLREYFDGEISTAYKGWLTQRYRDNFDLADPDQTVIDNAKDFWTGDEFFDRFKDTSIVREQVRNFTAIVSYKDSLLKSRTGLGGSILNLDGTTRFVGIFLSDSQIANISQYDSSELRMILAHEAKHALTSILNLTRSGGSYGYKDIISKARWSASGLQQVADPDLPTHADNVLFRDNDNGGNVLGGTGWLKDAYYAAENGGFGISNYKPSLKTGKDEPYKRLHEAANHAWWLQTIAARDEFDDNYSGSLDDEIRRVANSRLFVRGPYSSQNPAETLATLEEVMWGARNDWEALLEDLERFYPWLLEAWLEGHVPPEEVVNKLEELGWTIE